MLSPQGRLDCGSEGAALNEGLAGDVQTAVAEPRPDVIAGGTGGPRRWSVGPGLDHLLRLLPPGGACEFARGPPRRMTKEELLADLEALVRLMQVEERRP